MVTTPQEGSLVRDYGLCESEAVALRALLKAPSKKAVREMVPEIEAWERQMHSVPTMGQTKREAVRLQLKSAAEWTYLGRNRRTGSLVYVLSEDTYAPALAYSNNRYYISTFADEVAKTKEPDRDDPSSY